MSSAPAIASATRRPLERLAARWAFIRHVPPRKIARRLSLDLKRRVLVRVARRELAVPHGLRLVERLPLPIMPPRRGRMRAGRNGIELTFLNRTRDFTFPIPWQVAPGDRREQLWSMSLHYMEYLEEAEDSTFVALVEDWLASNVPYGAGYWRDVWNSYAVSLRVVVWMQQLAVRPALSSALRSAMGRSIAGQLAFLERNLETDLGGNHLVKNIKALLWGSACFAGPASERWRRRGLELLDHVISGQVLSDGVHDERSASYHAQVFVDLMECRAALGKDPLEGRLDRALAAMAQAVADLAHTDGGPVLFNDSGMSMSYPPATCLAAYQALAGVAVARRPVFAYLEAGYFGCHQLSDSFIADCGPIAPDALPAHGHGDVLSFEWSLGGRRLIVDQGVHEYVAGPRRKAARSAASHNTLAIEGFDQAEFFGDFRVGKRPRVTVAHFRPDSDGFVLEGSHDGFARIAGGPVHARRFTVTRDRIAIEDRLDGPPSALATRRILLHPDVAVVRDGQGVRLSVGGCEVVVAADADIAVEPAVWWPDLGVEIATLRLVVAWPAGAERAALELRVVAR